MPIVTGFVSGSEASLATALGQVARLDRRACRSAAETRFSARRMAADHLDAYAKAAAGLHPARRERQRSTAAGA